MLAASIVPRTKKIKVVRWLHMETLSYLTHLFRVRKWVFL